MKFWRYSLLLLLIPSAFAKNAADSFGVGKLRFKEGKDYFSYSSPIKTDERTDNKILVQSFFDYDCRNCSDVQDVLELYAQLNSNQVMVKNYPIALPKAQFSARTFYSLKAVGREDVSDSLLLETSDKHMYNKLSKMNNLLRWLEKKGVDGRTFKEMYDSPEISAALNDMVDMTEKYGVFTYPFVVIQGKYALTNSTLYNDDYTFAVMDYLVKQLTREKAE